MECLDLDSDLTSDEARFTDVFGGLARESLLSNVAYGSIEFLEGFEAKRNPWPMSLGKRRTLSVPFSGDVLELTLSEDGVRLFLWGLGRGTQSSDIYMDESEPLDLVDPHDGLRMLEGVRSANDCWEEVDIAPEISVVSIQGSMSLDALDPK